MRKWKGSVIVPLALVALMLCASGNAAWAGGNDDDEELEFDEAELYFELNDTDKDLGIHGSIDGGPWTRLNIDAPRDRRLLAIRAQRKLRYQGMTQLFFESAEPNLDEVSQELFFKRFREGEYEISGLNMTRQELENEVYLSQVMADRPRNVTVAGVAAAENCDDEELPTVSGPVVIDWDPVTVHHPEIGKAGPVEIVRYQFFVEFDDVKLSVDLPPSVTSFEVPAQILALNDEFKFEIIARTATGNNTAIESCFVLE